MKTVWEVLIVVAFALVVVTGLVNMGDHIFETQTLTNDSVAELSLYSAQALNYTLTFDSRLNETVIDPYQETDLNQVEGFVQEYRDYKGRFDQLKDGLKLLYKMPDLVINVVPFLDVSESLFYANLARILIWILLLLLTIVGLKNGQLLPQF